MKSTLSDLTPRRGLRAPITPRRLMALRGPMPYHEFGTREVLICRGDVVGGLSSRVRRPGWPGTLALVLIDPQRWQRGAPGEIETVVGGRHWPLDLRETAWSNAVAARNDH